MSAHSKGEYKQRYWSDPEFRAAVLRRRRKRYRERFAGTTTPRNDSAKVKARKEAKLKRCPEFRRLLYLTSTVHRLRNQIEEHEQELRTEEKRLIAMTKELIALRAFCKGK